jgi:collagen type IV alpha
MLVYRWLLALIVYLCFIVNTSAQMWNDIDSGSVGLLQSRQRNRPSQRVPDAYDIVDVASAPVRGPPEKNCTGSGCCIPKCFAEKGNRGLPGVPGYPGPKGK